MFSYFTLVFWILIFEFLLYVALVFLPFRMLSTLLSKIWSKGRTVFIILGILLTVAFAVSIQADCYARKSKSEMILTAESRMKLNVDMFRAQRNTYLTGVTLFLFFALWRTIHILDERNALRDQARALKAKRVCE
eukprot:gnl/Trimastix_PCT/2702.p1 GENE.gnl/Trimastix_PCT/2702~~gnl/Trimastix_PCT/2702.p1  ORF type:complete len:135 (+),score=27.10 gnl/Trimastix_PCT/2702:180-584(+)